jgi:hypothetical protein
MIRQERKGEKDTNLEAAAPRSRESLAMLRGVRICGAAPASTSFLLATSFLPSADELSVPVEKTIDSVSLLGSSGFESVRSQ